MGMAGEDPSLAGGTHSPTAAVPLGAQSGQGLVRIIPVERSPRGWVLARAIYSGDRARFQHSIGAKWRTKEQWLALFDKFIAGFEGGTNG